MPTLGIVTGPTISGLQPESSHERAAIDDAHVSLAVKLGIRRGTLLAATALWFWWSPSPAVPELDTGLRALASAVRSRAPAASPPFELETSPDAAWRTLEQSSTLRLSLSQGRFALVVRTLHRGQRFLLDLPDGELEVQGTRFVVHVADGHTQAVSVSEGRVALRIHNRTPFTLGAGQAWSVGASSKNASQSAPAGAARPPAATPESAAKDTAAPRREADAGASPTAGAGDAFSRAMSAFSAGDYAHAEALFTSFAQLHPRDARVEDVAFLRAVARARRGDTNGARLLAREYLRVYPHGLRRLEAERLAR